MTTAEVTGLLQSILAKPQERTCGIKKFQEFVFHADQTSNDFTADDWVILGDLAHDLDYYEHDPALRSEDPSYYGDERLVLEVQHTLDSLRSQASGMS